MGRKVKVAAVQTGPVFMDKKRTIEKFAGLIEKAGEEGAELIVFPETAIPGYPYWRDNFGYLSPEKEKNWRETVLDYHNNSVRIQSEDTDLLRKAAAKANAHCVIGISEIDDRLGSSTLYNTMLFLNRKGEVLGRHRKVMPTYQERIFWGRGDASDVAVFDTDIGRLGGLICYENHVTLAKAAMAMKGEEIHVAQWPGWNRSGNGGKIHMNNIDSAVREYAFETQTFVVSSSMYFPEKEVPDTFPYKEQSNWGLAMGGSSIVNPFGQYIVEPVFNQETIIYAEIDFDDRIVAKNIFDTMGHYTRWDIFSLNVRENDVKPFHSGNEIITGKPKITYNQLEEIAKKCNISQDKLDEIIQELLKSEFIHS
jgi:nitrilase